MHRFIRYWLPVLLLCTAIFIQSSYPSPDRLPSFDFSDKLLHAFVFGILGALNYRALNSSTRRRGDTRLLFWASVAAAALYGLSDELHQAFVPERHADAADLMADVVGGFIGCYIYGRLILRPPRGMSPW